MKRKLLSSMFALSMLILGSGIAIGQSNVKSLEVRTLDKKVASISKVELKGKKKSATGRLEVNLTNKSVSKKMVEATTAVETPYFEDFENPPAGIQYYEQILPGLGWTVISGGKEKDMFVFDYQASGYGYDGSDFFLFGPYDDNNKRDEWVITPGVTLEAGKTYKFEMYGLLQGYAGVKEEFKVAVGTSNTVAAMTTVVIDKTGSNGQANKDWVKYSGKFTPTTAGTYYFGLNFCSPKGGDAVFFDNILIADENFAFAPTGTIYTKGGLWSEDPEGSVVLLSAGQQLSHTFSATHATSFSWSFDNDASASSTTDKEVTVSYMNEGIHNVTLNLTGEGGSKEVNADFDILRPFGFNESVGNIKPADKITIYGVDNTNGYLAGPNSIYGVIAEKYELPSYEEVQLTSLVFYVGGSQISSASNQALPFEVYIIAEDENGTPANGEVLAYFNSLTYGELFGSEFNEGYATGMDFSPVKVTGSFFVVVDFSEFVVSENDFIALLTSQGRPYSDCSTYAFYKSAWTPTSKIFQDSELSTCIYPTIEWLNDTSGIEDDNISNSVKVSTTENVITIKGAEGLNTSVTTLDGKVIYNSLATDNVEVSVSQGIYIVKTGETVTKVIVR